MRYPESLDRLLLESTEKHPEAPLLCFLPGKAPDLTTVTYRALSRQAADWARELRKRGIGPGDRVGIISPKSPRHFAAFYACWMLGAVAVPVCEALADMEMGFIIRDAEPGLILVDASLERKVRENAGDIPIVDMADLPRPGGGEPAPNSTPLPPSPAGPDDVAALIYTSGSTGMPKGVMLTHRNFIVNAVSALETVPIRQDSSIMSLLPYWHSFALTVEIVAAVWAGAQVTVPQGKRDFKKNIGLYRPTIVLLVPRIADALKTGIEKRVAESPPKVRKLFERAIHNASRIFTAGPRLDGGILRMAMHHAVYDPLVFRKIRQSFGGRLEFFVSGGAPLDLEHQIFFKYLGIPIYQGYGLTESSPVISVNSPTEHRLGSSGKMLSWLRPERGGDYTFLDENGNRGKELHGELLVKGACVMKGYWRHRDASAKTLTDGWLHTGDMGYVDEDGYLFLEGRQGNMIVLVGGEKLHPEHVEDAIKTSPLISEAMVIGESCKNVYALVNVDEDALADTPAEERQARIRREVAERCAHLAAFQRPKDVLILPEFTVEDGLLTVTMKVRRHQVLEKYGDRIREFLRNAGEEIAVREKVTIASSKIMESLGRD